jgi:dTDP-4-dehydrorhamnose 3,5-epimerase
MIELLPEFEKVLTFQDYPPTPEIEGVWVQPLRKHHAENGWFMEYARVSEGHVQHVPTPLEVRQISISRAEPGRINVFHIHTKLEQNEIWTVIQGQLMVWLVDCRKRSPSAGVKRQLILNGEQPVQLHIPAGVAHGYKAGQDGATLLYTMDQQFDPNDPNEGRLPMDCFGNTMWEADRG